MKSIIIFILSLTLSGVLYAASQSSSMRTQSGQIVSVGDSYTEMVSRLNQSPLSMNSYEYTEAGKTYTAINYSYPIENIVYTFTVINNRITKIEWFNQDP